MKIRLNSIKAGIYKITNLVNGKFYIGSAKNFRKRLTVHLCELDNQSHKNTHLQRAWNKYGEINFVFEILEEVENKEDLTIREQYYLNTLLFAQEYINKKDNRFKKLGYNITPTANSQLGFKHSLESIKRSADKRRGKSTNFKGKKRPLQDVINSKKAIKEKYPYGYKFTEEQLRKIRIIADKRIGVKLSKEHTLKISKGKTGKPQYWNRIPVVELDERGVVINVFESTKLAAIFHHIERSAITNAIKGRNKTAAGSKWTHYNTYISNFNV